MWQFHEVNYDNDPDWIFGADGAIEAALAARQAGKIRFIGFTGHKSPHIMHKMLAQDFDWDTCQMPINAADAHYRSFQKEVLPELNRRGIGCIGMRPGRQRQDGHRTGVDGATGAALLVVLTHQHARLWHYIDGRSESRRGDRPVLRADVRGRERGTAILHRRGSRRRALRVVQEHTALRFTVSSRSAWVPPVEVIRVAWVEPIHLCLETVL
ncbi:MAG: hypothetical protein R2856_31345 [Caldilineaceae bacterium]